MGSNITGFTIIELYNKDTGIKFDQDQTRTLLRESSFTLIYSATGEDIQHELSMSMSATNTIIASLKKDNLRSAIDARVYLFEYKDISIPFMFYINSSPSNIDRQDLYDKTGFRFFLQTPKGKDAYTAPPDITVCCYV